MLHLFKKHNANKWDKVSSQGVKKEKNQSKEKEYRIK